MDTVTLPDPRLDSDRTLPHQFSTFVCGQDPTNDYIQVVGLTGGKAAGLPALASAQNSPAASGTWTPAFQALTGAVPPNFLTDLTVCAGMNTTSAVGLGNDGKVYVVGRNIGGSHWKPGSGVISQSTTFREDTLTSWIINTGTCFAVSSSGAPWVAAYQAQDTQGTWTPGYALPSPQSVELTSLQARPDMSDDATTHAIGLTTDGQPFEVAYAAGRGTGVGNWKPGQGYLGQPVGLPVFQQLVLVSSDAKNLFHVIGLGKDGSLWDVDQFTATAAQPSWLGQSTQILPAGTIHNSSIQVHTTSTTASYITLDVIAWVENVLTIVARFTSNWTPLSQKIPTSGLALEWRVVENMAHFLNLGSPASMILGIGGLGFIHELAYHSGGTWTEASSSPINN
ncbi:hypothetical protein [Actomonas aquatica]|uniref:Uncharacterized protein n=1 Tax=Actomonas aquatica TaxID=2866162 RepID=A0ABZ1C4N6_9BACT|nr:hypothetical protein [Opitutus sp. WL0086]WRQ86684.1 hypothetical protein K1X11_017870 [Opitutus sp. WL0086]